jgi:hypothetical protein
MSNPQWLGSHRIETRQHMVEKLEHARGMHVDDPAEYARSHSWYLDPGQIDHFVNFGIRHGQSERVLPLPCL